MSNQEEIETLSINNVEYIRKDQACTSPDYDAQGRPYVIVRSRNQGVMSGYLVSNDKQTVVLDRARQFWSFDSPFVLLDLAEKGPRHSDKCQFSCELSNKMTMTEACGYYECTEKAAKAIRDVPAQDKS